MLAPAGHQAAQPGANADDPDADEPIYLWPCNVLAWNHWWELQTQWLVGPAGATGLNWPGIVCYLDEEGITGTDRQDIWRGVRAAEREMLALWRERREREELQRQQQTQPPQNR